MFKKKNQATNPNEDDRKFICAPYNKSLEKAMRKTFHSSNFNLSFRTKNNAFQTINKMLSKPQSSQDKFNGSGIYQINCNDCSNFYICQTAHSRRGSRNTFKP